MLSVFTACVICGIHGIAVAQSADEGLTLLQQSAAKQFFKTFVIQKPDGRQRPESMMLDDFVYHDLKNNSANRPSADEWRVRLQDSIAKGKENPCSAPVLVPVPKDYEGLGWQMLGRIYQLAFAVYGGFPFALHASEGSGNLTLFDNFFKSAEQLGYGYCPIDIFTQMTDSTPFYEANRWAEAIGLSHLDYVKPLLRFVAKFAWTLEGDGKRAVEARIASLGISEPYVGVHIRHSDKGSEAPLHPTGDYAHNVDEVLGRHNASFLHLSDGYSHHSSKASGLLRASAAAIHRALRRINSRTVFLATDDLHAKRELRQYLGEDVTIKMFRHQKSAHSRSYADGGTAMQDVMMDMEALRRSDVFICTGSSSLAKVTWALRTGTPDDSDIINLEADSTFMTHQSLVHNLH